jgi:hypothetical protein
MFWVDRPTLDEILDLISPIMIEQDEQKAMNSSGMTIHPKTHLAVMLRWLAGGSHIHLCFVWLDIPHFTVKEEYCGLR